VVGSLGSIISGSRKMVPENGGAAENQTEQNLGGVFQFRIIQQLE
jgi:hypothetical protein